MVVNGAGAAATACNLYAALGLKRERRDGGQQGVVRKDRKNLSPTKAEFATDKPGLFTLEDAVKGADVFLGVSKGNTLSQDMVRSMAKRIRSCSRSRIRSGNHLRRRTRRACET